MLDFLKKTESSHQAALCQSATASVCQHLLSSPGPRGKSSPIVWNYGASVLRQFHLFSCKPGLYFYFFCIFFCILVWLFITTLMVVLFAQTYNCVCEDSENLKSPWCKWKSAPATLCYWNLHRSVPVPLNQQPEVRAWLSEHTLPSLWRCGLKHLLLFCFVCGYYRWHGETAGPCLKMHMADTFLFIFLVWDNKSVILPLVY